MELVKVDLPPYKEGCDADPAKVACDYPPYKLNKLISTKFADSGSPGRGPGQELHVDQRRPEPGATDIAEDEMDPEDAAKKWVEANPDKVDAWLN